MCISILQTNENAAVSLMRDISSELCLIIIYTEHTAPCIYVIVFKHVIRVIITFHVPETLEGRVHTLLEALDYVYLHHYLVSSRKYNRVSQTKQIFLVTAYRAGS